MLKELKNKIGNKKGVLNINEDPKEGELLFEYKWGSIIEDDNESKVARVIEGEEAIEFLNLIKDYSAHKEEFEAILNYMENVNS